MPFTHTGGTAGRAGTLAMQQKIGKLRKHVTELEQVVVERNRHIKQLKDENKKLREALRAAWKCAHAGISCSDCRLIAGGCTLQSAMRELRIEVPE